MELATLIVAAVAIVLAVLAILIARAAYREALTPRHPARHGSSVPTRGGGYASGGPPVTNLPKAPRGPAPGGARPSVQTRAVGQVEPDVSFAPPVRPAPPPTQTLRAARPAPRRES